MKHARASYWSAGSVFAFATAVCTLPAWNACSLNPVSEDPGIQFGGDRGVEPEGEVLAPGSAGAPTPNPGDMATDPNGNSPVAPSATQLPNGPSPSGTNPAPQPPAPEPVASQPTAPQPTDPQSPAPNPTVAPETPEPDEGGPMDDSAGPDEPLEAESDAGADSGAGEPDATAAAFEQSDGGAVQDAGAP